MPNEGFGLVMPFVCVASNGGTYDDAAFVAGARYGQDEAQIKAEQPAIWQQYVYPPMVVQYDLLAMHLGYTMTAEPWAEFPDEWVLVTLAKASSDPAVSGEAEPSRSGPLGPEAAK